MGIKSKFFVSLQHSGRRWVGNVVGTYYQLINGQKNPDVDQITDERLYGYNPFFLWGISKEKIVSTHCNNGFGNQVLLPRAYGLRPAVILDRHPARLVSSNYRTYTKLNPQCSKSLQEFTTDIALDFLVEYYTKTHAKALPFFRCNVEYSRLFAEQQSSEFPQWEKLIKFLFGAADHKLIKQALELCLGVNLSDTSPESWNKLSEKEKEVAYFLATGFKNKLPSALLQRFDAYGYLEGR